MQHPDSYRAYLYGNDELSNEEHDILVGFIEQRNAIRPTSRATRSKQACQGVYICRILHENGAILHSCTVHDLLKVAGDASSGAFTKNSRQTKIVILKALTQYIHRFHHPIENLDLLTHDVKAGSAAKNRKDALTLKEWDQVLNLPMPARDRAMLAMLYDGYHRPREILLKNWCDLHTNERGDIEYEIIFKTEKTRTIVQKPGTTEILEAWRKECGAALTEERPIFPGPDGKKYETITTLKLLFNRLKKETGIPNLKPSILRTTAITHDVEAGLPVSYICLRAWGEPYNELINLYTKPDSGRIQRDQHEKIGMQPAVLGKSGKFSTRDDKIRQIEIDLALANKHIAFLLKKSGKEA